MRIFTVSSFTFVSELLCVLSYLAWSSLVFQPLSDSNSLNFCQLPIPISVISRSLSYKLMRKSTYLNIQQYFWTRSYHDNKYSYQGMSFHSHKHHIHNSGTVQNSVSYRCTGIRQCWFLPGEQRSGPWSTITGSR